MFVSGVYKSKKDFAPSNSFLRKVDNGETLCGA